jgi:hypothetical protein
VLIASRRTDGDQSKHNDFADSVAELALGVSQVKRVFGELELALVSNNPAGAFENSKSAALFSMVEDRSVPEFHNLISGLTLTCEMEHTIPPPIVGVSVLLAGAQVREDEDIRGPSRGFDSTLARTPITLVQVLPPNGVTRL